MFRIRLWLAHLAQGHSDALWVGVIVAGAIAVFALTWVVFGINVLPWVILGTLILGFCTMLPLAYMEHVSHERDDHLNQAGPGEAEDAEDTPIPESRSRNSLLAERGMIA